MERKALWKRILIICLCTAILTVACCGAAGVYVYNASVHAVNQERRSLSCKKESLARYGFDVDAFEAKYHVEEVQIPSTFGHHKIPANYLTVDGDRNRKTVVMAHGLNGNRLTGYPVAEMLMRNGYNILTYDQRDSGENQAPYMTCGYWESMDFKDCVDYVRSCTGNRLQVGGWGSSIGGATVGFYLGTDHAEKNLDFAVLDCPVSDMEEIIACFLTRKEDWIPERLRTSMGSLITQFKLGFSYRQGNVCDYVRNTTVPVLIFNTTQDRVTPYHMAVDLFQAMENNNKQLVTVDDCPHTDIYLVHPEMYEKTMINFIREET